MEWTDLPDRLSKLLISAEESTLSSVSDLLYLIAALPPDTLGPEVLQKLNGANLHFIKGDVRASLGLLDQALVELDPAHPGRGHLAAYQLFMAFMTGGEPGDRSAGPNGRIRFTPEPLRVISVSIKSERYWHSGNLFRGLALNQSTVRYGAEVGPLIHFCSVFLLAKKLTDIHVPRLADKAIDAAQELVDGSGLHALGAVPESLRSVRYLQSGRLDRANQAAASAVEIGEHRRTVVGLPLALSVAATAQLRLGEEEAARACLKSFHMLSRDYALTDSVARAAFAEVALIAAQDGPQAAADRIRAVWSRLGTRSACLLEDPTRPAWLIAVARRAGDDALAERALDAVRRLAANNRGIGVLDCAVQHAEAVFAGEKPESPLFLDSCSDPTPCPATGARAAEAVEPARAADVADAAGIFQASELFAGLSRREREVAQLVGGGLTNKQVGARLGVSSHTVNFHLRKVFRKLSISTRVMLGQLIAQVEPDRLRLSPPDSD